MRISDWSSDVCSSDLPRRASELPRCLERGQQALAVMEKHVAGSDWFTGPAYGIADIALFAYIDVADDGGFDLSAYPAIRGWLARVRATPGFVAMRSEEHTSELLSLMRISYAVFCLRKNFLVQDTSRCL